MAVRNTICIALFASLNSAHAGSYSWTRTQTWALISSSTPLTSYQANFSATHYDIVGLGGTFGGAQGTGEVQQAATARQLKECNSAAKVIIYRNTNVNINGQLASDATFLAHPEWILHNSSGDPLMNSPGQPFFDTSVSAMRDWFVSSTVAAIRGANGTVDGVFADGSGDFFVQGRGVSNEKNEALNIGHTMMLTQLHDAMQKESPDLMLLGNGAVLDSCLPEKQGPCSMNFPSLDGVCAEHFGSFEAVNATSGNFNGVAMDAWVDVLTNATKANKIVLVKGWPGPFSMYCDPSRLHCQFTWKNMSNITITNAEKQVLGSAALDWTLAAYLLVVAPNTYLSYSWWYQLSSGFVPCPNAPGTCACPNDWYPDLLKSTGHPIGLATRVSDVGSGHVWERSFEMAYVRVDLGDFAGVEIKWK